MLKISNYLINKHLQLSFDGENLLSWALDASTWYFDFWASLSFCRLDPASSQWSPCSFAFFASAESWVFYSWSNVCLYSWLVKRLTDVSQILLGQVKSWHARLPKSSVSSWCCFRSNLNFTLMHIFSHFFQCYRRRSLTSISFIW